MEHIAVNDYTDELHAYLTGRGITVWGWCNDPGRAYVRVHWRQAARARKLIRAYNRRPARLLGRFLAWLNP